MFVDKASEPIYFPSAQTMRACMEAIINVRRSGSSPMICVACGANNFT
jgi:hypothetical protein